MMDLYCVIDIGSNTVRLVIYQLREGVLQPILNNKVAAGLASYVDKQNRMTPDGWFVREDGSWDEKR